MKHKYNFLVLVPTIILILRIGLFSACTGPQTFEKTGVVIYRNEGGNFGGSSYVIIETSNRERYRCWTNMFFEGDSVAFTTISNGYVESAVLVR